MNEYVIMPASDYQSACDAIRAASGKTDPIKSGDLSTEIAGVVGSSGEVSTITGEFTPASTSMTTTIPALIGKTSFVIGLVDCTNAGSSAATPTGTVFGLTYMNGQFFASQTDPMVGYRYIVYNYPEEGTFDSATGTITLTTLEFWGDNAYLYYAC